VGQFFRSRGSIFGHFLGPTFGVGI
jgi:hypothetical protein